MNIALMFDGGGSYGIGNIVRSAELASRLRRRGHAVSLLPQSPRAATFASCPYSSASAPAPGCDWAVIDTPYVGDACLARAKASATRVLGLDYEGLESPDVVLGLRQSGPKPPPLARAKSGLEYAIIRQDLIDAGREPRGPEEGILVLLGGGDSGTLLDAILRKLMCLPEKITVVQGPNGSDLSSPHPGVSALRAPKNLARIMADCRWAVTGGGTSMLELMHMGKAVHVVPRTEAEACFSHEIFNKGVLLGLGVDTLAAPPREIAQAKGRNAATLIDGQGCERIAATMENFS